MEKIVIFTAIIGKQYDSLYQPLVDNANVDFVCFVKKGDKSEDMVGKWKIRELVEYEHKDNTRMARYVKMHPHSLLPEYDYCVWIDGNIQIVGEYFYTVVREKIQSHTLVSSMRHPHMDCTYDDAYVCIASHKDSAIRIFLQILYLKIKGFPPNFGLYETNVFFRDNKNEKVLAFNNLWWKLLSRLSRRDQLGCTYSMWKVGIPINYFFDDGKNARNSESVRYYVHLNKKQSVASPSKMQTWIKSLIKNAVGYRKNYK